MPQKNLKSIKIAQEQKDKLAFLANRAKMSQVQLLKIIIDDIYAKISEEE